MSDEVSATLTPDMQARIISEAKAPSLPSAVTSDGADFLAGLPEAVPNQEPRAATELTPATTPKQDAPKPAETTQERTAPKLDIKPGDDPVPDHIPDDAPMPRQSPEWKKFRATFNETKSLLKDREAKIAELTKLAESAKEVDSLRQERDDLAQRIKLAALEGDKEITGPYDSEAEIVRDLAKADLAPDKIEEFESLLKMPPGQFRKKALAEFTEDMSNVEAAMVAQRITQHDSLMAKRAKAVADAKGNYDNILKQRESQLQAQKQAKQESMQRSFDKTINDIRSQDGWRDLLAPENPSEEHKEFVERILKSANQIYNGNVGNESELARASLQAVSAPILMGELLSKAKEIDALKKQLEEMSAATPGASSTNRGTTTTVNSSDDFLDGIHKLIGR